ncbi:MAG: 50S ribosomal protein L29 [Dehalococcoidia bacterium]|nr:50S ribosomal protein L29 [Dehalococcoidia bacterium]
MTRQNSEAEKFRSMSDNELESEVEEVRKRLFQLRLQSSTRQLENYRELRRVRRQVARLQTLSRERRPAQEAR